MATSHQSNGETMRRSGETSQQFQNLEEQPTKTSFDIPKIMEHLASDPAAPTAPQLTAASSTILLHTMFHLLDRIEVWLEVVAQHEPGFEGGRKRGDPRLSMPAAPTTMLQVPPLSTRRSTQLPSSPTKTIFSPTASSVQGNRPRPSEYERSLVDLRHSFGLAGSSRHELVFDEAMPRNGVVISRQHTPALPRVSEDIDPEPVVTVRGTRRKRVDAPSETRLRSIATKQHAARAAPPRKASERAPAKSPAKPQVKTSSSAPPGVRPSRSRRVSPPARPRPNKRDSRVQNPPKPTSSVRTTPEQPQRPSSGSSGAADYSELASLVANTWRQSILLKFESAKERYRFRNETPPEMDQEVERGRRRFADKPLPPLPPATPPKPSSQATPRARAIRRRPLPAYV